jgi:predicted ATPase
VPQETSHEPVGSGRPRIFINYRRDDAAADAGRLYDALSVRFGEGSVFMDIDAIPPGADFAEVINQAVGSCEVLIAVIGKRWLSLADAAGARRLDDQHDLVRMEILAALERKVRVVPVLVQGAPMPRADQLPTALARLAGRHAFEISYTRWQYDVERLIAAIDKPTQQKVLTFMATGVEDSIRRREVNPVAMRRAMEEHDRIVTREIARHQGSMVESGREGESMLAAFRSVGDALRCAIDVQRAFADQRWPRGARLKVRVAINTGQAELRGGRYYGEVLYRCAGLMAIGHGGQILLTQASAEKAVSLPAGCKLVDLGVHRLRDLDRPEHVHQLRQRALEGDFPALKSQALLRDAVPIQLTSFIDREVDVEEVTKLLRSHRLVTLVGPAGVGKTRLALRVAGEFASSISTTVAELAAVADPALLPSTVANALGLRDESRVVDARAIADWLAGLRVLLVLDNCEHLIDAVAALCEDLLAASSGLTILATSGESLKLQGEAIWRVGPLPARTAAVRLFNDRARLRGPRLDKDDDTAAVVQICERLDGLPLAIELAAARAEVMSPREMVARLNDRFALLGSASRSKDARHRTLRSAIDWSYELLSAPEKMVFARSAVFAGGFDLEAAEAVCAGDGVARADVAEMVWKLVDKSLVAVRQGREGQTRQMLLETLRDYGLERLADTKDDGNTRKRHAAYFLALAEKAAAGLNGPDPLSWLRRMDEDNDNFRAALSGGGLDAEGRLRMTVALTEYWDKRGRYSEARQYFTEALAASSEPSTLRATALRGLALMALSQNDLDEAGARSHESLEMCRRIGDPTGEVWSLEQLARISHQQEDLVQARELASEALALARPLNDEMLLARCQLRIGLIEMFEGNQVDAARNLQTATALGERTGDDGLVVSSIIFLGYLAAMSGDVATAGSKFSRALSGWRENMSPRVVALILDGFAFTAAAAGQDERALRLAAAARALRRRIGTSARGRLQRLVRQRLGRARKRPQGRSASARGARMTLAAAIAYALGEAD